MVRTVIVAIFFWLSLGYGLFLAVASAATLWQHIKHYEDEKGEIYCSLDRDSRLRAWIFSLPDFLLSGLSWPLLIPTVIILAIKGAYPNYPRSFNELRHLVGEFTTRWYGLDYRLFPVAVWAILLAGFAHFFGPARVPALAWLGALWIGIAAWLVVAYVPSLSLRRRTRLRPEGRYLNILFSTVLFAVALPLTSSFLILTLGQKTIDVGNLAQAVYKVYTLRGIIWEGPQNTFRIILSEPHEGLYLTTALLLYGAILSKIPQAIFTRVNDEDLQAAAVASLVLGYPKRALDLLRQSTAETMQLVNLRICGLLMLGDVTQAKDWAESKLPFIREYVQNQDVATTGYLLLLACQWRLDQDTRDTLLSQFLAASPNEEELTVAFFGVIGCSYRFATEDFASYSHQQRMRVFMAFFSVGVKDKEQFKEACNQARDVCSIFPSVQALADSFFMFGGLVPRDDEYRGLRNLLRIISSWSSRVTTGSAFFLFLFVLGMLENSLPDTEVDSRAIIQRCKDQLTDRLAFKPYGQNAVKEIGKQVKRLPTLKLPQPAIRPLSSDPGAADFERQSP